MKDAAEVFRAELAAAFEAAIARKRRAFAARYTDWPEGKPE